MLDAATHLEALQDPVRFGELVLKHRYWAAQKELLRAVSQHKRVAVKSAHSTGKTHCIADLVLYWLARHKQGCVITTSSSARQVEAQIWSRIRATLAQDDL